MLTKPSVGIEWPARRHRRTSCWAGLWLQHWRFWLPACGIKACSICVRRRLAYRTAQGYDVRCERCSEYRHGRYFAVLSARWTLAAYAEWSSCRNLEPIRKQGLALELVVHGGPGTLASPTSFPNAARRCSYSTCLLYFLSASRPPC